MDSLQLLQKWYVSQCDDDWEHSFQVKIETLDNPGWIVRIDLTDTELENREFDPRSYGVGEQGEDSGNEWLDCKVESKQFRGAGGPLKLDEILRVFLEWAGVAA